MVMGSGCWLRSGWLFWHLSCLVVPSMLVLQAKRLRLVLQVQGYRHRTPWHCKQPLLGF
uniref:Uncharacterized protein n=1 Tax=Rhizophora mucronata TaxID=61149 RepID=A0A2P2NRB0_RHIMU